VSPWGGESTVGSDWPSGTRGAKVTPSGCLICAAVATCFRACLASTKPVYLVAGLRGELYRITLVVSGCSAARSIRGGCSLTVITLTT